jgi:hypothetical protein
MRNRCPKNETGTITDFREQETKDSVSSYDRAESMSSGEQATNDSVSSYVRTEGMSSGEQATKDSVDDTESFVACSPDDIPSVRT